VIEVMKFAEVEGWGGRNWFEDVTGVAVDSTDRVVVLRGGDASVTMLDANGTELSRWRHDCFSARPHLVAIGADERVYIADDGAHLVFVFDLDGHLQHVIGSGIPSVTGYDPEACGPEAAFEAISGGPPFNRPTKVAPSKEGEFFVSDGYRNCRIHRFSADLELITSWGGAGSGPGSFVIPHSVSLSHDGRVFVCDRENDRIQIFTPNGVLLDIWDNVQRPTDLAFDRVGNAYVAELPRGPKDLRSWRLGRAEHEIPGRVSILSSRGDLVGRVGGRDVEFLAPHAIAVDSKGAVYVSEVPASLAKSTGRSSRQHRCLRKFEPL
jgi:DNA-binding beta-propeller fold protein YncE